MSRKQKFGGHWTETKLVALEKYYHAYAQVMRRNRSASVFTITYVDGFAGSGRRYVDDDIDNSLFDEDAVASEFYRGSVRRALEARTAFDRYIFIESKQAYIDDLQLLVDEFPERRTLVEIRPGDANSIIPGWCSTLRPLDRALVFLDPYGMQVSWETVKAIAATKKIDLWVLVPLGQALVRLLTRRDTPPESWSNALTRFFGTEQWKDEFYVSRREETLFGEEEDLVRDVDFGKLTGFFVSRLGSVFASVLDEPIVLRNQRGTPLYLLCFAASNPNGAPTAVRIARDIAKRLR